MLNKLIGNADKIVSLAMLAKPLLSKSTKNVASTAATTATKGSKLGRLFLLAVGGGLAYAGIKAYQRQASDLKTVNTLDLGLYEGKWYEIARFPSSFEKNLVNTTATYNIRKDGRVSILNKGHVNDPSGEEKEFQAIAWRPDFMEAGKLKVRFLGLFTTDYWVIDLDEESYQWAMVGSPTKKFFWILSRTPNMAPDLYNRLVSKAKAKGFETENIERVLQEW